jgi:RNA polymerase sigma-70 factor (ECF subfamily)
MPRPNARSPEMTRAEEQSRKRRFETVCLPFRADVFRFALWLSRSRTVAEEVVQETLLRAWRSLDSLKDGESAKSWLLTIARREHARLFERKRHPTVDLDSLTHAESEALAEKHERDQDEVNDVRRAILELEPEHREPLIMQVMMGFSTEEIARHMGINEGAVSTRLFRARNRLRARLGLGPDESAREDDREDDNGAR